MSDTCYSINSEYWIKKINDIAEFEKIRTDWDNLAEKQGEYAPFLCFDWFKMWLEHFLNKDSLLILLLYKGDELVAIAPLLYRQEIFKGIKVNKIELIGNIYSPIRYFLINSLDNKERENILFYIFEFFAKFFKEWDIIDLYPVQEENYYFELVEKAINREGFRGSEYFCFKDCYLDNIGSADEYFNILSKSVKKDISYNQRRLQKMGNYEFKLTNNGDIDDYMDVYYGVYSKSWQEKESIGPNFHRDLAKIAMKNGWLRLGFLFFNDVAMASQFWITCDGTAFILKTVYDQKFKKYSPGKILTSEMMKSSIDKDKVKTVDYIHGDEAYKEDWAPKRRERKGIMVFNHNSKGIFLELLINRIQPVIDRNNYLAKAKKVIKSFIS